MISVPIGDDWNPSPSGEEKFGEVPKGRATTTVRSVSLHNALITSLAVLLPSLVDQVGMCFLALIKDAIVHAKGEYGASLVIASHDLVWLNNVIEGIERIYDGRIVGHETGNIINGSWKYNDDCLWEKSLPGGEKISAVKPPHANAVGMLNPSDIMPSTEKPEGISAQNVLQGTITQLAVENDSGKILTTVNVAGLSLVSRVTEKAIRDLHLLPGMTIWVLFKASSLTWY